MMFSARLPSEIRGQIADEAEEAGLSEADLLIEVWSEWYDRKQSEGKS